MKRDELIALWWTIPEDEYHGDSIDRCLIYYPMCRDGWTYDSSIEGEQFYAIMYGLPFQKYCAIFVDVAHPYLRYDLEASIAFATDVLDGKTASVEEWLEGMPYNDDSVDRQFSDQSGLKIWGGTSMSVWIGRAWCVFFISAFVIMFLGLGGPIRFVYGFGVVEMLGFFIWFEWVSRHD